MGDRELEGRLNRPSPPNDARLWLRCGTVSCISREQARLENRSDNGAEGQLGILRLARGGSGNRTLVLLQLIAQSAGDNVSREKMYLVW